MMKATELRSKNTDELNNELVELRRAQFNLRMQAGTQQLNNPDQMKKTRRNIARIKTVLAEKAKA